MANQIMRLELIFFLLSALYHENFSTTATSFFANILALEHSKPKSKTPFTTCNDYNQDPYCLCPSGQRISVFKSHHHNPNEDRIWQLECAPIQLVKIEESQAKLYIPSKY